MAREDTNVVGIGVSASIPNLPRGRLMYYLDCVNSLLDLGAQYDTSKLRNFESSHLLTDADTDVLISMCFFYAPDKLDNHVIFQDDNLCGNSLNKFHDIETLRNKYQIGNTLMIGNKRLQVNKVMTYRRKWLLRNWINPMHFYGDRLARITSSTRNGNSQAEQLQSYSSYGSDSEKSALLEGHEEDKKCCCIII